MPRKQRQKTEHASHQREINNTETQGYLGDERFSKALSNPLFKQISQEKNKVVLDERFKSVLTDEKFRILPGGNIDPYGRKVKRKSQEKQALKELQSFYTLDTESASHAEQEKIDDEDTDGIEEEREDRGEKAKQPKKGAFVPQNDEGRLDYLNKLARGELSEGSEEDSEDEYSDVDDAAISSDEDDYDDDDDEDGDYAVVKKSPLDIPGDEDVEYGDATKRLSILNCDWENIKSADLMMILQSFVPPGKKVLSVTIYPSDFGKERMAEEAKYGPQGIWKKSGNDKNRSNSITSATTLNKSEGEDNEEDDENQDLYEGIEDFGKDSEADNEDDRIADENSQDEVEEQEDDDDEDEKFERKQSKKTRSSNKSKDADGDFRRKKGAVGIVLHDDLKRRRRRASSFSDNSLGSQPSMQSAHSASTSSKKKKKQQESDVDEVALRQYELSKLRYYFAIAECDSIETANLLYEQLDDVELGDSAMAIELRFVPDDLDLSTREVHDSCHSLPHHYKPPQFVINALQHTNVECSWDQNETERDKKLTNISSWRSLKESEFMQYIASSDSEDYEAEEEEDHNEMRVIEEEDGYSQNQSQSASVKSLKKKKRAKQLRKLLLGGDGDDDNDDDQDNSAANDEDDFFMKDPANNHEMMMPQPDENGEITFTYIPEAGKELLTKKKHDSSAATSLTPYEIELQKSAERKKAKKQARQAILEQKETEQQQLIQSAKEQYKQKKKKAISIFEEEEQAEYNDEDRISSKLTSWEIEHQQLTEKRKKKLAKKLLKQQQKQHQHDNGETRLTGGKGLGPGKEGGAGGVDISDERFKRVFEGTDANFGIDRTSLEFKATPGMETILKEQRIRREQKNKKQRNSEDRNDPSETVEAEANEEKQTINSLVNKLKRKFSDVN